MKSGVRVTGGAFRGRGLAVPAGTRPTGGRVREALFSIWRERLDGARFLDLFAGSGVVGLEAAGRGALRVVCVDQDRAAVRSIAANAALLGEAQVEVCRLTLPTGLPRLGGRGAAGDGGEVGAGRFDLVFADPPYSFDAYEALLGGAAPLLATEGELAVEHAARRELPLTAGSLARVDIRRYGESAVSFYRTARGPASETAPAGEP
ncbi:MAG TPA: 16S rRNA (guanine(966)-N(2))-methyltransferase RsmD [Thermoanaerobaculia bacterium]|nr:16S rRNA (guanine(966)-N(2))-methyltransferase RsmD [Thermoanaerobaculia bacterium]